MRFAIAWAHAVRDVAMLTKRTATTSNVPNSEAGKDWCISWTWKDTFGGNDLEAGNAEAEKSKPTSWEVEGRLLATSKSQIPVPVPTSAIFRLAESSGMFGWMRKPNVLVVAMCCSSNLSRFSQIRHRRAFKAYLSGISSSEKMSALGVRDSAIAMPMKPRKSPSYVESKLEWRATAI